MPSLCVKMSDIEKEDDLTEEERALFSELLGETAEGEEPEKEGEHTRKGWLMLLLILAVVIVAGSYTWIETRKYDDCEVKEEVERNDDERLAYIDFAGNLFSYSRDGASYADYDNALLWSESFDMENPVTDMSSKYLLLYDKQQTRMILFDENGLVTDLVMNLPIVSASVSTDGRMGVLMQEGDTGYLQLFEPSGEQIASGELHVKNTGYPIAMDLSNSGTKMLVSVLNLNDGDIKTTLSFYDFSNTGKKKDNYIVASFSYADMVIPTVAFGKGDKAVAFGDNEIVLFTGASTPRVKQEIFVTNEIKSVFYNDENIGFVALEGDGAETLENKMSVYTMNGRLRFETTVDDNYTTCELNTNNEVVLSDRENINIYNKFGVHKLSYTSEETIYQVLPWDGTANYYFIKKKITEKVRLR